MFRRHLKFLCLASFALSLALGQSGNEPGQAMSGQTTPSQTTPGQTTPSQTTPGPVQPIPFSHKVHVTGAKLVCADCHVSPANFGDAVSIPDAPKCLECHAYSTEPTPLLSQLNAYVEKTRPIPWVRVFSLKSFVFFDHRYHLMNGATCEGCHGPIGTEDVVADRLGATQMSFCQPCHVKSGANTRCDTCHDPR